MAFGAGESFHCPLHCGFAQNNPGLDFSRIRRYDFDSPLSHFGGHRSQNKAEQFVLAEANQQLAAVILRCHFYNSSDFQAFAPGTFQAEQRL